MTSPANSLLSRLGLTHPIIQAPMAGATTPALVAAASEAGALGSLGVALMTGEQIHAAVREIRALTGRPFAINVFTFDEPHASPAQTQAMARVLEPFHRAYGVPQAEPPARVMPDLEAQVQAALDLRVPVFSFTFGMPDRAVVDRLRRAATIVMGTATNVREALALEALGVDAIVAQGAEAGGHRGTFIGDATDSLVGTLALVPQVVAAVKCPVVAAGGLMNGAGIAAVLRLGAAAAQLGTAFLACPEASIHEHWRRELTATAHDRTCVTRAFTGRYARAIRNRFVEQVEASGAETPSYPIQMSLVKNVRAAASKRGDVDIMPMWAGQGAPLARRMPAADLVRLLARELADAGAA